MLRKLRGNLLEGVAVVALIVATAWLGRLVHHNYVLHPGAAASAGVVVAPASLPTVSAAGAEEPLRVRAIPRDRILLVLKTDCPVCEKNMPQWVQLQESLRRLGPQAPEAVVVSVNGVSETLEYLDRHGLDAPVRFADPAVLPLLGISGYPSTVAVDADTGAVASWSGILAEQDHRAVQSWAASRGGVAER